MCNKWAALAVTVCLLGYVGLAWSDRPTGDQPRATAKEIKFTCTQHGPTMMTLTLVTEAGGSPRKVVITGANNVQRWMVTADGMDVTPSDQTPAGNATLKVRAGDTLTWRVTAAKHGVTFADQDAAEAALEFQPGGKNRVPRPESKFQTFGPKPWGTDAFSPMDGQPVTLAVAKVKGADKEKK